MSNVQLLFGPLLIGAFLGAILYGILLVQSFIYFRTYRKDRARMRYFVLFLVLCDTLHTVVNIGIIYEPLVFRYGTLGATQRVPILSPFNSLMTAIIIFSVQSCAFWRIKIITRSWIIPGFIGIFIFSSLAGGVATCICGTIFRDFVRLERFKGAVITWLTSSAIADIMIAISFVVFLSKLRTGNANTDDVIDRIIRLSVHSGAVTALFATLDMVLFVAIPNESLNFAFGFPLAKLYTSSLLATLNARGGWYGTAQQCPDDNFVHRPVSWNTINNQKMDKYVHNQTTTMSSCVFANFSNPSPVPPMWPQQQGKRACSFSIDLESASDVNHNRSTSLKTSLRETEFIRE